MVIVLLAVGLVVFLAVAAVAIDLGVGYASSRQMQNAADAAALAGTQELECLKLAPPSNTVGCQVYPATASAVADVVAASAAANGSSSSDVTCDVISGYIPNSSPGYQVIAPCSDTASWVPYLNTPDLAGQEADGVYVLAGTSEHTFFGSSSGLFNMTQRRQAAATVQTLVGGGSPLLACAYNQIDQSTGGAAPPLVVPSATSPTGYAVNPASVYNPDTGGPQYFLHGPHVADCNLNSSAWKGLSDESQAWSNLPGWLPILTGDKAGPTRTNIANQANCPSLVATAGCVLVVPVCISSNANGGINGVMYCVGYGAFRLLNSNSNSQNFGFLGLANATAGQTGAGNPDPNGVNVVALVQ